jgi:asparagine N-glycosylation enzyme membrane subunit Stt3
MARIGDFPDGLSPDVYISWPRFLTSPDEDQFRMLWTIAALLLILWLLGMVSSYTLGGFIHILLVLAVIAVLIRIIQGRSPV